MNISGCLTSMLQVYRHNPSTAVRGQRFIRILHSYIADELKNRLHPKAIKQNVRVIEEALLFGSHKPKKVDVACVHPTSGPLVVIGVRSQMSSVGKNALTYYQDIVGECISLQDRFPLAVHGYAYLHPLHEFKGTQLTQRTPDHQRYARMYEAISGREGRNYGDIRGLFDEFAYLIVDFGQQPPNVMDTLIPPDVQLDLSIDTFVDRIVTTFQKRHIWIDLFK